MLADAASASSATGKANLNGIANSTGRTMTPNWRAADDQYVPSDSPVTMIGRALA